MAEIQYAAGDKQPNITLGELEKRFAAAGVPAHVKTDSPDRQWLAFEGHESILKVMTQDGKVTEATLNVGVYDEPKVVEKIKRVLQESSFSVLEKAGP
jgi:hypothetical protein